MPSKMPQELEVWYVIPALRAELARDLAKNGMKQNKIAEKLDVTEAAVSHYIKNKRAQKIELTRKLKEAVEHSARRIAKEGVDVMKELHQLCQVAKQEGVLCKLHHADGYANKKCKLCLR